MARQVSACRWARVCALLAVVVSLSRPTPASAQADDAPDEFDWPAGEEGKRDAFDQCRKIVDWVANGRPGSRPDIHEDDPPGGDKDRWRRAIHADWITSLNGWRSEFVYRPKCHLLLPDDYVDRVPSRYKSEAVNRCRTIVESKGTARRPPVVPAWYWELSIGENKKDGDKGCSMLLPLGAFGLGDDRDDDNAWSQWTAADEEKYPDPSTVEAPLKETYELCKEFIVWRMANGEANSFDPLGDRYEKAPDENIGMRVWHEALNFFVDPNVRKDVGPFGATSERTLPATWRPNCELLLNYSVCKPGNSLMPELCLGPHAIANYDINYSECAKKEDEEGGCFPFTSRNMLGGWTQAAFLLGKGAIQISLWSVDWAFRFDIQKYNFLALDVGDKYETHLLGHRDFRLRELLWLALLAWTGYLALRGRLAAAGAEIMITVVLLLLSAVLMHQRDVYMKATWRLMDEASNALLVAGMGKDPTDGGGADRRQLMREIQTEIQRVFVHETYDHLNWGQSLGEASDPKNKLRFCANARDHIVAQGPHGTDPLPRKLMEEAGNGQCTAMADFNRNPTGTRLLGALLVMISSITIAILMTCIGLTIVLAKLVALLLFAVAPFAALATIPPGPGRRLAWSWATTLLQVVLAVIGMSFVLSLLLLTLKTLIGHADDVPLIEMFVLMNLVVFVMFAARRSLLASGQNFAKQLSEYASAHRGSGMTWASAGQAASSRRGLDLLSADRPIGYGIAYGVGATATTVGRSVVLRFQERRVARRAYRNLQNISRWKRRLNRRARYRNRPLT
jgi:hypothetical protein